MEYINDLVIKKKSSDSDNRRIVKLATNQHTSTLKIAQNITEKILHATMWQGFKSNLIMIEIFFRGIPKG